MTKARSVWLVVLALVLGLTGVVPVAARDWNAHPASVEIPRADKVVVVGDIHGAFQEFADSLLCAGLIEPFASNTFKLVWNGGTSVLVCVGDYGDRWHYTKEVMDAVMDLEKQAAAVGGRVVPLCGNHEFMILNGTVEKRARGREYEDPMAAICTIRSFERAGLDYYKAFAPEGTYGAWVRNRPLFCVVNGWMVVHAGPPFPMMTRDEMVHEFRKSIDNEWFSDHKGILLHPSGPLYIREWWVDSHKNFTKDYNFAVHSLENLGVRGIVFGHTPGAWGAEGFINAKDQKYIGVDIGMTPYYRGSHGGALVMTREPSGKLVFRACYPNRVTQFLFATEANPGREPAEVVCRGGRDVAEVVLPFGEEIADVRLVVTDLRHHQIETPVVRTGPENGFRARFVLTGLRPGTKYFFRGEVNGEYRPGLKGSFRTDP